MAFPASRFTPGSSPLELCIPAQLTAGTGQPKPLPPSPGSLPAQRLPAQTAPPSAIVKTHDGRPAVEVDRVVPASGNLWIGGQQVWLGPALSGRQVTLWVDPISLQFLSQWLDRDPSHLAASLAAFAGHPSYGLDQLRGDLERFVFLLGGSDGEQLFGAQRKNDQP
jgi:hypothetical protein